MADAGVYLREVTALVDKIAALRMKAQVVPVVSQAVNNALSLEQEVSALQEDVSAVLACGEEVSARASTPQQAHKVQAAVQELNNSWSQLKGQAQVPAN